MAAATSGIGVVDRGAVVSAAALPLFFVGSFALGVWAALTLIRRGHDTKTMTALVGRLGPLMLVISSDGRGRRERSATPVALEPGVDHVGPPEGVLSIVPSLEAAEPEVGMLTVAAVDFESVEGDFNLRTSVEALALARTGDMVPISGPAIALWQGTIAVFSRRFRTQHCRFVLVAFGDLVGRRSTPGSR